MKGWWQRRPLRFRLALWYALGGAVLLAAFSATVYLYVSQRVARPLDHELRRDLARVQEKLALGRDGRVRWGGRELSENMAWPTENPWFEIWDDEHRLVKRMWPFDEDRVQVMPVAPAPGRETLSVFNVGQDLRLRVLSVPYALEGEGSDWMIRIMRVHKPAADTLGSLRLIIIFSLPIVIALLVCGGYIITRRWLSPLDEMVAEASSITAETFDRRLPVANPHDELGRLAGVFNVTLDRLSRSFSALKRFVADASHELRTPLTTLRSVGEIGLRRSRSVEEYRDIIGSMLEEAQRLQNLVQRLLELASAEGGAAELHRSTVQVDALTAECVAELSILAENKSQKIELAAKPFAIITDPVLLRQALQNVLDNAIKYSPEGSTIRIAVSGTDEEVSIAVSDQGAGISAEDRPHLAERFYRPDRGRDRGKGGFGLGLSLTKAYMSLLGGRLEFTPAQPTGSIFTLTAPAVRAGQPRSIEAEAMS